MERRLPRVVATTVVKRDPPVKRASNYARGQRCPYVDTAVSADGHFVSQRGRVVSRPDQHALVRARCTGTRNAVIRVFARRCS